MPQEGWLSQSVSVNSSAGTVCTALEAGSPHRAVKAASVDSVIHNGDSAIGPDDEALQADLISSSVTPSVTVGKGATSAYIQVVLEAIVVSSPAETNSKCNEAWLGSVMSGMPQASDSATSVSGTSGAL